MLCALLPWYFKLNFNYLCVIRAASVVVAFRAVRPAAFEGGGCHKFPNWMVCHDITIQNVDKYLPVSIKPTVITIIIGVAYGRLRKIGHSKGFRKQI
jgi:hypothetical protein